MKQQQVAQHRCGSVSMVARQPRMLVRLLAGVSASAAALALSFAPQQARAQAVNGTPTVVFGSDAANRSPTLDSFNVTANEALIDWAVTDPAVFLNAATTLNFSRDGGAYTVLNRVVSSPSLASTLALNGRIQSDSQGQIWFYNPGGWAVGAGATIDVGSLLLTASPITVDPFDPGNPGAARFLGDTGAIRLGQTPVAGAKVLIDPLASIVARGGDNSYVALVAPRVEQAGVVTSDGSVAYVGAEAADITINNGLFDIAVTSGTTDPNGVVHTGTTTGPASFGSTPRTQFLVAVGKNDAMTMLVRGQLGYDAASSAGFVDGRIVLSSGQGITANNPDALGTKLAGISLSAATLRNDLSAAASDRIAVSAPSPGQSVLVVGNATLAAKNRVDVSVSSNDSEFEVRGDLSLAAQNGANGGAVTVGLTGGGALLVDGSLFASADGFGAQQFDFESGVLVPGAIGEAARGGTVAVTATNATIRIGGATQLSADARGGIGGASAGSSTAGSVSLVASGSSVQLGAGGASLFARGFSANDGGRILLVGTTGAASSGGSATLDLTGATTLPAVVLDNSAFASSGIDAAPHAASTGDLTLRLASGTFSGSDILMNSDVRSADGGSARGGAIDVAISAANLTLAGGINQFGRVEGDIPTTAGAAGSASLKVDGGGSLALSNLLLTRQAVGTVGGKVAKAGDISLEVSGGGSIAASGGVFLRADGRGSVTGLGPGGSGTGGTIGIIVDNGSLAAGSAISANAIGLAGGSFSGVVVDETGRGGAITLTLGGVNGTIAAPNVGLDATGTGFFGEGSLGPSTGIGGAVAATVNGGSLTTNDLSLVSIGVGANGSNVGQEQTPSAGGTGRGGSVSLTVNGGAIAAAQLGLDANGEGGSGASSFGGTAPAGRGGDAFGGSAGLALNGGTLSTNELSISAGANVPEVFDFGEVIFVDYYGAGGYAFGDGGVAGAGGSGTGGSVGVTIDGGALAALNGSSTSAATPLSVNLDASGFGGNGGSTGGGSAIGSVKGDGGLGTGGSATLVYTSGSADFLNLAVNASGRGGIAGFEARGIETFVRAPAPTGSSLGADGGDGRGGTARVTIAGDLAAFDANGDRRLVLVDATGAGGNAADGDLAGNGGNGFGGSATLEIDGATVALIDPSVDATGSGGFGGRPGQSNPGGDGGAGFGGSATLRLSNEAAFTLTGGALIAQGFGADGRAGANGNNGLLAPGNGGKGGDAQGGVASLLASGSSTLTLFSGEGGTLAFDVSGEAGDGGLGGASFGEVTRFGNGGAGGSATGGGILIEATDTALDLGAGNFNADGFGGEGGERVTDESGTASEFSAGGDGGDAQGGSIRFTVLGEGAALNFSDLTVSANGFAGSGADGQGIDATTFAGAPGGKGGAGTGGSIVLEALSGGAFTAMRNDSGAIPGRVSLVANGLAGVGGDGANGATNPSSGVGGAGGNGGNSGQGDGGSITLVANGGTFSGGSFEATAKGVGRFGGFGGAGGAGAVPAGSPPPPPITPPGPNGADGTFGFGGAGVGGTVDLSALTDTGGAVGGLSLGDTFIDVTGTINFFEQAFPSVGGKVSIIDRVDDSIGGLRFASLGINASGDVARDSSSVAIESSDGPIVVDGNLSISAAGDVNILTFGTGGVRTGGFFEINNQGTVQIDDDFCAGIECPTEPTIAAGGPILVNTAGNFLLIGSPTLVSDSNISIDAGGSITGGPGSGYRTPGSLTLSARGDIAVRNADVGSLDAKAGRFVFEVDQGEVFEDRYNARDLTLGEEGGEGGSGGGRIVVANSLTALAGGDVTVTSLAEISTGRGLSLVAGDDILLSDGASLKSNLNAGGEPGTLSLDAGGLATVDQPVAGNVASLFAGSTATIDAGTGGVQLIGGAIDTRGASIVGADFAADVRNPPAPGVAQGTDNGQLAAPCLAGDICIGSVTATGQVRIGQGDEAPVHFLGTRNITADSIAIRARETLAFGSNDQPLTVFAGGAISLESQAGDIDLFNASTLSGGSLDLSAGASLIGNGSLTSAGDIGITVGDSVTAGSIIAAGQLTGFGQTGGDAEALFSVPGSFTVTQLQLGADAAIAAGEDIVVGSVNLGGNDVDFDAGGLVSLGSTAQVGDIALSGDRAAFGALVAGGSVSIDAVNAVSGTSAIAGGVLSIDGTTIAATTLRSGGATALTSSGATTIGSATSGAGLTIGSGALIFSSLTSTGATTITAASVAGGNIAAGSGLDVRSTGAIGLGTATAGTTLALNGTTITATRLQSGQGMALTSSGRTLLGTAASGAGLTIASAALDFSSLTSTGATAIMAASVAGGNIAAGTGLDVRSPGAIGLGTATAGTTLALNGTTITATRLQSGQGMGLTSNGATTLGSAASGAGLTIASGALDFGSLASTGSTAITAASVTGGDIDAGSSLSVSSDGAIDLGDASAGTTLTLDGSSITASALDSGGDSVLTAGSVNVASIDSGGGIDIAAGSVELGSTQSAALTKVGAGTLTLSSANASGGLELNAEGSATLGSATSGAQLSIVAGDLTFDSLTSSGATSLDAASVSGGDIDAGGSLAVVSGGAIELGNASAGSTLMLDGSSIAAGALNSGDDTSLRAGTVTANSITSGGDIAIAADAVALGSTSSAGLTKVGTGTLTLSSANATGGLELTVEGPAMLGSATSGARLSIVAGDLTFDSLTSNGATLLDAASVSGGDIYAGDSLAVVSGGAIDLGDASAGSTLTLDGSDIAASALASGGDTSLLAGSVTAASIASGGRIDIAASGAVALGSTSSTGLTKVGAGTLTLSSANATGGLELTVADAATLGTVQSGAGVTASARDLRFTAITASGTIAASATTIGGGNATSTAGAVALTSTAATTVGLLRAGTDVTVTAPTLTFAGIDATRNVTLDIGTLNGSAIAAGQDLTIRSVNSLTFGTVGAGRNVSLSSSNGTLTVNTDLDAGGTIALAADGIAVRAAGALRVNAASADNGNISIVSDGLLRVDSASAIGDITLTSTASSLIVGGAVAGDAPNVGLALTAETTTGQGSVGAGAITLGAANDITLLATVDANTALAATAGGLIDQRGLAVGRTVAYRSADIALGQGASLGQSNFTTGIALTNTASAGAILGDVAGTTAGYRLDNAEFGRVHSGGDLSLAAGSSLNVGTLSASAANAAGGAANGNIGATSTLALSTSGELSVGGALALGNAGGNTLRLTSGGTLFVDAGNGSVRLVEGSGRGGSLAISAGSVMALTPAARTAIVGLDTRALDQRLAMNDGVTAGRTLIEGGAVTISSNGAILIQNTAPGISFDERRGFAVDSLTLTTRSDTGSTTGGTTGSPTSTTGLADIVINGTVGPLTGLSALRAVQIEGSFSDFSTINGCRIVTASCGNPTIDPIRDLLEEEVEVGSTLENSADGFGQNALIVIDRIEPAGFETVIDEPVTGAGNDDFLVPEAGAGDEVCTEEDQTKCDKPPVG